jgi:hypothetical protein
MKTCSGRCGDAVTQVKRLVLLVALGATLVHHQASFTSAQTKRVLDVKSKSTLDEHQPWVAIAMVLEYATGHRMKPCQLQSLAVLPYLRNSKRLRACCAIEKGDLKQICEDPAVNNYQEMSAFLTDRLGIRNEVLAGPASFNEIVKNIDNDRPVFIWLERTGDRFPLNKIVVVIGYHSFEERYSRNTPPGASLVVFDPWKPELYGYERIENRQLVSYPDVQSGYSWVGTIVLLDSPSVKTPRWVDSNESKPYPDDAIQAGTENNQPIYVCRAGETIGKLNNRKCHITYWAGYWSRKYSEASKSNYEVLIGDQAHTSWGASDKDYVDSVNVNDEPDPRVGPSSRTPSFLCRATVSGKVFFGMVYGSECVFFTSEGRQELRGFDTLNFKRPVTLEFPITALETELSQQLLNAENRFTESIKQLTTTRGTLPDGGTLEGYNVTQVKQVIEQGKSVLLEHLEEPAFSGFKAYANRFYPLANNLVTFPIKPDQKLGRSDLKVKELRTEMTTTRSHFVYQETQEDKEHVLATPGSVDAAIAAVVSFFGKLRGNIKAIDLSVISEPDEAGVELKTELGKLRTTSTNSKFTNVFRGLYTYTVRKNGYKGIQKELNLIDEEGTILKCKLYLSRERDGPYPCSLK